MKTLTLALSLLLTGCGTAQLSTRLSRTIACDEVHVSSWWQWFGITTKADSRDAAVILAECKKP